jgi:hypothetical protein
MRKELQEVVEFAELILIAKRDEEFLAAANLNGRAVIDLVRMIDREETGENYQGICW